MATPFDSRASTLAAQTQSNSTPASPTQGISPATLNSNITSYHANEATWSDTNLPDKLFQLEPGAEWGNEAVIPCLTNSDGTPATNLRRIPLRDYGFLPDQISIHPEAYRLEMYLGKLHSKCGTFDLYRRMHPAAGKKMPSQNGINMTRARLRNQVNVPCWTKRSDTPSMAECLILEQVSWESIRLNTVLPLGPMGLFKPCLTNHNPKAAPFTSYNIPRDYSRIQHMVIPFTTYVRNQGVHMPSPRLEAAFDTLADLQSLAFEKGYPHWVFLENQEKPSRWTRNFAAQHHSTRGPQYINVPDPSTMPTTAVLWIEFCIQKAVQDGDMQLPLSKLSRKTRKWVNSVVGRAGKAVKKTPRNESEVGDTDADSDEMSEVSGNTDWDMLDRKVEAEYQAIEGESGNVQPSLRNSGFDLPSTSTAAMEDTSKFNNGLQYEQHGLGWGELSHGQLTMHSSVNPATETGMETASALNGGAGTQHDGAGSTDLRHSTVTDTNPRLYETSGHLFGSERNPPPPPQGMFAPVARMERQERMDDWILDQNDSASHQNEAVETEPYYFSEDLLEELVRAGFGYQDGLPDAGDGGSFYDNA
ncbi:hypothetical protein MMC30_006569 [Trapelia coarctata]|nr:hypothetical protein [Trapelia coarctata]